jgi:tRNA (cytidine/uridine-2'-O-)-methyltransferase
MRLALFQPDIPQNLGAVIRLTACFAVPLEVIQPCAFPLDDRSMKRAALDYGPLAHMIVQKGWSEFLASPSRTEGRLVLFTTKGAQPLYDFSFQSGDTLLFGRESAGVPDEVHAAAHARVLIPIAAGARSFNLAVSAGIGLSEALRQTGGLPGRVIA